MKTPQVSALAGVTPLGIDPTVSFINYCLEFYGAAGLYRYGFTREELESAVKEYCARADTQFCGDSADREFVRDIVFAHREAEVA